MVKEVEQDSPDSAATPPVPETAAAGSRDVLWIDKFLAKKQDAAAAGAVRASATATALPATGVANVAHVTHPASATSARPASMPLQAPALVPAPEAAPRGAVVTAVVTAPVTAAEAEAARSQHQAVQQLCRLPQAVEQQVAALAGSQQPVSDALLRAVWIALESNTRTASADWVYVDSRHGYAPPNLAVAAGDAGDALLPRYADILPPKATALADPVRSAEYGGLRYLHANHVDLGCGQRLILGQKPVAGEIAGLHQMLVDEGVGLIVDLTRYQERENHCAYVPEQQGTCVSAHGRKRLVCCTSRSRLQDLKAVRQQISIDDGTAVTRLQRLRFPGWPDHGVIAIADLIALADTIEVLSPDPRRPVLVHCLAGVGRSGTLTSFMAARRKLAAASLSGQPVSADRVLRIVLETIARGRLARGPSFVQMEEQFYLLVRALLRGRPGMVERRQQDVGPGETPAGVSLPEARQTPQPVAGAPSPARPGGVWQRLRRWCGLG